MNVVTGMKSRLENGVFEKLSNYRCQVFVERLGWDLRHENGMEIDQFDRTDTVYLIAQNDAGDVQGCARLLPTTRPYLLSEVFPELLHGKTPPCSTDVWELSRFAATDLSKQSSALSSFSSPVAVGLLQESLVVAGRQGAKRLITEVTLGVERLMYKAGFLVHRAAPPLVWKDGHPVVACWIDIPEELQCPAI